MRGMLRWVVGATVLATSSVAGATLDPEIGPAVHMHETGLGASPWSPFSIRVASNGSHQLVSWCELYSRQYVSRVEWDGTVTPTHGTLLTADDCGRRDLIWAGDAYVLVWMNSGNAHAVRLDPDGNVLAPGITQLALPAAVIEDISSAQLTLGGGKLLLAWASRPGGGWHDLYGAVLEPQSLSITAPELVAPAHGVGVADGFSGGGFGAGFDSVSFWVAWGVVPNSYLLGRRMDLDGALLDTTPTVLRNGLSATGPRFAAGPSGPVLAWGQGVDGPNTTYEVRATLLDPTDPDAPSQLIAPGPGGVWGLELSGAQFLLLQRDNEHPLDAIMGRRLAADGTPADAGQTQILEHADEVDLVGTGEGWLAGWLEDDGNVRTGRLTRVSSAGAVLDPDGILLAPNPHTQRDPVVAYGDDHYLAIWSEHRDTGWVLVGSRVDNDGVPIDIEPVLLVDEEVHNPALSWDGRWLLSWTQSLGLYFTHIEPDLTLANPGGVLIDTSEENSAHSFDGANTLISYVAGDDPGDEVRATRISPAGTVLDVPSLALAGVERPHDPVRAAWGGAHLVTWGDDGDAFGRRVSATGLVLDSEPSLLVEDAGEHALDFGNGTFLLAADMTFDGLRVQRIRPTGVMLGSSQLLAAVSAVEAPTVAFDGSDFAVAWTDSDITFGAAFVTPAGTLGTPTLVAEGLSGLYHRSHIASDCQGHALLVYERDINQGPRPTITNVYARHVSGPNATTAAGCAPAPALPDPPGGGGVGGSGGSSAGGGGGGAAAGAAGVGGVSGGDGIGGAGGVVSLGGAAGALGGLGGLNAGGSIATGGASPAGGAGTVAGTGASQTSASTASASGEDTGCGCATPGPTPRTPTALVLALFGLCWRRRT